MRLPPAGPVGVADPDGTGGVMPKGTRYPSTVTLMEFGLPLEVYVVTFKLTHGKYPSIIAALCDGSVSGFEPVLMLHGLVPGHAGPSVVHDVPGAPPASFVPSNVNDTADMLEALYEMLHETQGVPVAVDNALRAFVLPVVDNWKANWQSGVVEV